MISDNETPIGYLRNKVQEFTDARDWAKYHSPKDVSISIAIETAELLEHFQWVSEDTMQDMLKDTMKIAELKEELADIMIYCFSFANTLNIDVAQAVIEKIKKNEMKYPVERVKGTYRKYTELHKSE